MGDVRRLIAFDLDGTLIDSRRDLADSANQLIVEHGGTPLPEDAVAAMVGEGARLLVQRALAAAGLADRPEALQRFLDIYDTRLLDHTRAYPGIREAVMLARAHARLAVLTNKPARPAERILQALGLRELFDDVVGGDGPLPRKPDPASLIALMARAGAAAGDTLLVGDSRIDRETAHRAGVRCCMAAYGFGYAQLPAGQLTDDEWVLQQPAAMGDVIAKFVGPLRGE